MKKLILLMLVIFYSCNDPEAITTFNSDQNEFNWIVPIESINGSFNPFPLAKDPIMSRVKDIDYISNNSLVAIVSIGDEIKVYPYQFISNFEAVNDKIGDIEYSITYCPITQSGLVMDRNIKNGKVSLRASGYLFNDNLVLYDENSDTYWSQMETRSIKGKYANELFSTHNLVELPWKIVKEYFPEGKVFIDTSIQNKGFQNKKGDIQKGDHVFGVIDFNINQKNIVYIYDLQNFTNGTVIKNKNVSNDNLIIIGNRELQFITTYINDSNAIFKAVQNQFPIVMEDDKNNKWNVFGVAISGPRKGDQLNSKTSFNALWWAWQAFYDDINFEK